MRTCEGGEKKRNAIKNSTPGRRNSKGGQEKDAAEVKYHRLNHHHERVSNDGRKIFIQYIQHV